jgi:PAS domain S-box-containing protein
MRARHIAPVALVLGLTVAGFLIAHLRGEGDARRDSEHRAEVAAAQIRDRVVQGASLTESLRRFMLDRSGTGVTSDQFARNALRWLTPAGFPAAAWVERVPDSRRASYERRIGHAIVTPDQRHGVVRGGSRASYLPATLVSGFDPLAVPGTDLGGEPGMATALTHATRLDRVAATAVASRRGATSGLFLVAPAPNLIDEALRPGYIAVFVSDRALRAAATDAPTLEVTGRGAPAAALNGVETVRGSFVSAGQRFDVAVPQRSVDGAAAALPWIILVAGLVLAGLAAALGVNAARRARAQQDFDRIFNLSPDLVAVANFDGHFTRVNPAAEEILGYTGAELLTRPYLDLVHPDDRERTAAEAAAIGEGKRTLSFENRLARKDGSYRVLEWTSTPVVEERAMYAVARDVTERREAEAEVERLADEQAALRRVATLVAQAVPPDELFVAVIAEVGGLLGADLTGMIRYEADGTVTPVAAWAAVGEHPEVRGRWSLEGDSMATTIGRTGRAAREDHWAGVSGPIAEFVRDQMGVKSTVGSPVVVEGRVWGALVVHSTQAEPLAAGTEERLVDFTRLVATAISNSEARAEVERLAEEQAGLRRVATLVAHESPGADVFAAVAEEVGRLLRVDDTRLIRYEDDGTVTVVASWGKLADAVPVGTNMSQEGTSVSTLVLRTERPARMDDYSKAHGPVAEYMRSKGIRSAVGTPILVEGRVWGAVIVGSLEDEPLPADTELRVGEFTELIATAIANIQTSSDLAASRARLVEATVEERRRVVRDLHDGAQARLVHTVITLKLASRALQPGDAQAGALLSEALEHAERATAELRELSHGILPTVLTRGGLRAGVEALAATMPVPIENDVAVGRLPAGLEATAYFVVAEALTNVAKHAHARHAKVTARTEDGTLHLNIRDDGVGGAQPDGSGLLGLGDRLALLDGQLRIGSPPGGGTLVAAAIPIAR